MPGKGCRTPSQTPQIGRLYTATLQWQSQRVPQGTVTQRTPIFPSVEVELRAHGWPSRSEPPPGCLPLVHPDPYCTSTVLGIPGSHFKPLAPWRGSAVALWQSSTGALLRQIYSVHLSSLQPLLPEGFPWSLWIFNPFTKSYSVIYSINRWIDR